MPRDKTQTRKKILDAVGVVLIKSGMAKVGINSVARQAKEDKVLIYRYFGSLDDLLAAYIEENELWPHKSSPSASKIAARTSSDTRELVADFLLDRLNELRRRKAAQEIMRGGLLKENRLTQALSGIRQKQNSEIISKLSAAKDTGAIKDYEALISFMDAALSYLVLYSKTSDKYWGIDLHSNFGWQRIEKLINELVTAYSKNS